MQILEEEILGDTSNEDLSQNPSVLKEQSNLITTVDVKNKTPEKKINEIKKTSEKKNNEIKNTPEKKNNEIKKTPEKTWGSHLNKSKSVSFTSAPITLNTSFSEKLLEGSKFKIRNPRKSLSFKKTKSNLSISKNESFSRDDSFQAQDSPFTDINDDIIGDQSFSVENDCSPKIKELITSKADLSPLFTKTEKFRIVSESAPVINQPVSLIQKVASEPVKILKSVRRLDAGWVERCSEVENLQNSQEPRLSSDSGFESMESSTQSFLGIEGSRDENKDIASDDEDDIIDGSDNEGDQSQSGFGFEFLTAKRKSVELSQEPIPDVEKQVCKKPKLDVFEFELPEPVKPTTKSKNDVKKEILESKIKSGTLNENYVKINIKKKVFVRGKKKFNYAKHKKQQWKNKKKDADNERESGGVLRCFKCNEIGHFSRYCPKKTEDKLLSDDDEEEEDSLLPTLEEAQSLAREKAESVHSKKRNVLRIGPAPQEEENNLPAIEPYYKLNEDGSLIDTPDEVYDALNKFGHLKFRPGQEEAVMRILSGQSTLVTISTGGGKSLVYQLPAYMYAEKFNCITLVVSPLVSLMEDQVIFLRI